MSVSVNPPKTPVTKGSNGIATATIPNVCKMPGPPAPFVPVPLPNIGKSGKNPQGYSQDVTIEGKEVAIKGATFESMGDVASKGTGGGLISANCEGITKFVGPGSMDVKIEGKNVQLLSDPMLNNCGPGGSPPNAATMVGVLQTTGLAALWGDEKCPICGESHEEKGKLEETSDTSGEIETFKTAMTTALTEARVSKPQVGVAAMMGVVKCKHGDKTYAATSSLQFSDVQDKFPGSWHSPKAAKSLKTKTAKDKSNWKANVESFSKHAGQAGRQFTNAWKLLEVASNLSEQGRTDEVFYPPGSCAGQQAFLHALDHGHRPNGMTEHYFASKANTPQETTFTSKLKVRDLAGGVPGAPRSNPGDQWKFTEAVPPCGTCQVVLTMLTCLEPKDCANKSPGANVCHKC